MNFKEVRVEPTPAANEPALSAEDEAYVGKLPEALRPICRRHGRALFQLVMQAGAMNHALGIIARQAAGNRAIQQALGVVVQSTEALAQAAFISLQVTPEMFTECRVDIERMAALADVGNRKPGEKLSPSGIILNS